MSDVIRAEPTAEGLARAFASALKPGPHGTPVISLRFGTTDGGRAGFVVTGYESGESYRITVEALPSPRSHRGGA